MDSSKYWHEVKFSGNCWGLSGTCLKAKYDTNIHGSLLLRFWSFSWIRIYRKFDAHLIEILGCKKNTRINHKDLAGNHNFKHLTVKIFHSIISWSSYFEYSTWTNHSVKYFTFYQQSTYYCIQYCAVRDNTLVKLLLIRKLYYFIITLLNEWFDTFTAYYHNKIWFSIKGSFFLWVYTFLS